MTSNDSYSSNDVRGRCEGKLHLLTVQRTKTKT